MNEISFTTNAGELSKPVESKKKSGELNASTSQIAIVYFSLYFNFYFLSSNTNPFRSAHQYDSIEEKRKKVEMLRSLRK